MGFERGKLKLQPAHSARGFMPDHDDRFELAPRDVVALAIDAERNNMDWIVCTWTPRTNLPNSFQSFLGLSSSQCFCRQWLDLANECFGILLCCPQVVGRLHAQPYIGTPSMLNSQSALQSQGHFRGYRSRTIQNARKSRTSHGQGFCCVRNAHAQGR